VIGAIVLDFYIPAIASISTWYTAMWHKTQLESEMEDNHGPQMVIVVQKSIDLEAHLEILKQLINEGEEDNTTIESANPYVTLIDNAMKALSDLRSDLQEII
jgi:hypothetical protein